MSLADTIESFSTGTYLVKRSGGVTYVDGHAEDNPPTELQVTASVQPLGGKELMRLPEGDRSKEMRLVFTTVQLHPEYGGGHADIIVIDGQDYEVSSVEAWTSLGFCKATVTRVAG